MENGLEVVAKKLEGVEKIYSLEYIDSDEKLLVIVKGKEETLKFIIWDLYNSMTETVKLDEFLSIEELKTRLARTSGNILQVDEKGKVSSVLKIVENKLKESKPQKVDDNLKNCSGKKIGEKDGKQDGSHTVHSDTEFNTIVCEKEPWVIGDYERNSYCLYQNTNGTEKETLQLIVGRSTVQIWHQVQDSSKKRDDLINKGGPFLEYIWTNGIPVNQERSETRLRVEEFKYKLNDKSDVSKKSNDFYLKVYWYERTDEEDERIIKCVRKGADESKILEGENEDIKRMETMKKKKSEKSETDDTEVKGKIERKERIIRRKDIYDQISAVRRACKALEHLNKRRGFLVTDYIKIHQVSLF